MKRLLTLLTLFSLLTSPVFALTESSKAQHRPDYFSGSYYLDDREFNTLNFEFLSTDIPFGVTAFGFVDMESNQGADGIDDATDLNSFIVRMNFTKVFAYGLGVQYEYQDLPGTTDQLSRVGFVMFFPIPDQMLYFRVLPYESDGEGGIYGFVFQFTLIPEKLFLEGFFDVNYTEKFGDRIITEPQLRYMVTKRTGIVVEYRRNDFLKLNPFLDDTGWAFGLTHFY